MATLSTPRGESFEARLVGADGKKIQRLDVGTEAEARAFEKALADAHFAVSGVEAEAGPPPSLRRPSPLRRCSRRRRRKLGFAPARTMQVAQRLYEGIDIGGETVGLITYMRTDGVDVAARGGGRHPPTSSARTSVRATFPAPRASTPPRQKNAQEAHEAIRPTDVRRHAAATSRSSRCRSRLGLYELIWKRTVASQMESAELERTTVDIDATVGGLGASMGRRLELRATGQVVKFDGFLALYTEDRDDDGDDDETKRLPAMTVGEKLARQSIATTQHFTEPPPRYSEASLVKRMEELGIGRPSTYAATLQTLQDREYVKIDKKRLVPEDKGRLVIAFLENFFERYVEYGFTAALEEKLDLVSNSELDWKALLRDFWRDFAAAIDETKELRVSDVLAALNDSLGPHIFPDKGDGSNPRACPTCGSGTLSLKLGKFGAFIGCSNYPECRFTRQLAAPSADAVDGPASAAADGTRKLGDDPVSGLEVTVRDGRFGPYVQLGDGEKPKRSSLPKGMTPAGLDLERALALLELPKEVAKHPESGEPILVGIGRYGPYVQHGRTYANLEKDDDVLAIGANRAIDLVVAKESGAKSRFGRGSAPAGRELGEHPTLGGPVTVMAGRYGPYVKHGSVNATLPKGKDPASLTMDEAVPLLAARAESAGSGKKGPARGKARAPADKAKAPAKKAAAKKPAAKKAAKPKE